MNTILKIHCIAAQSSFSGHSWIEFCPENGSRTTFGTWGNDPVGKGNGLFEGLELQYLPTHSRPAVLDEKQASILFGVIARYSAAGQAGWTISSPCSAFAAEAWEAATGERLAHRIAGISTPRTLAGSITAANLPQPPDHADRLPKASKQPDTLHKSSATSSETKQKKRGRRL